jgi:type VI secretion system protein VasG
VIAKDLRILLGKLNPYCTKVMETTVGSCITRTHYELTWEHMLFELMDSSDNDIACILKHYSIDMSNLKKALTKDLEQLSTGNSTKPSFSPTLINYIEQAWGLATLVYGRNEISSGILFVAAQEAVSRSVSACAAELRVIDPEKIKTDLLNIITASSEQAAPSVAGGPAEEISKEPLERFCKNFTQEAADGKIDTILGRDDEIRQVTDILSRRRKNNPILVGEAGTGKTAIVEGLALRIVKGDVPDTLKDVELWELDLGLLQAGASVKGEFEKRLKAVIDIAKNSGGKIMLFIDEAHTLIGAGGSEGMGDAANLLKPALARGELRTCAATTWLEYRKYFEKDPALTRRFQMVKVDEPDEEKAFSMLRGISESYEKHHNVHITDEGIRSAVSLSHRYISGRQLPDKAIDVLDTASTRVKMSRTTTPPELDNAQRDLNNAQRALKTLQKDNAAGIPVPEDEISKYEEIIAASEEKIKTLSEKWEKEKEHVEKIVTLQKKLTELPEEDKETPVEDLKKDVETKSAELEEIQGENPMVFPFVSKSICADVIGDWTGIPVGSMVKDEAKTLLELEKVIGERVIGQDEAIGQLAEVVRSSKSGMANPDSPIGVFLFTGPSGIGKTEAALALADVLFGGEKFSTVINMSEYQEKHTVSQLKGSPPGYVGYGEGGVLTEAVRQKPYSIVILDEVEKAHRDVLNMFYQVFDKGFMRSGEGRDINFRNTVIIMTSNLGSDTIIDLCSNAEERPDSATLTEAIRAEATAHFQPALLARCKVVPFYPLDTEAMRSIVELKLNKIVTRLKDTHGVDFEYADALVDSIAAQCSTVESGARNIDAVIDQSLLPAISQTLLAQLGSEDEPFTKIMVSSSEEKGLSISFE